MKFEYLYSHLQGLLVNHAVNLGMILRPLRGCAQGTSAKRRWNQHARSAGGKARLCIEIKDMDLASSRASVQGPMALVLRAIGIYVPSLRHTTPLDEHNDPRSSSHLGEGRGGGTRMGGGGEREEAPTS